MPNSSLPIALATAFLGGEQHIDSVVARASETIGQDWRWPAQRISRLLINQAANGAIMCLHDGRDVKRTPDIRATIDAVEFVIPALKERGFQFETVSEILCPTNSSHA